MWSTPEMTEVLTARASAAFSRHLLRYCHDTFGRNLTNEELAVHITQTMGVEVPREALKQYRNGRRFRLYFYQMIASMMRVPLSDFIYDEQDAKADRLNSTKVDFQVLYDLETGKPIMGIGHDTYLGRTLTEYIKVLQVKDHNNGSQTYQSGQLLLVDTEVQAFTFAGVYAMKKGDAIVISDLDSEPADGQPIVGKVMRAL